MSGLHFTCNGYQDREKEGCESVCLSAFNTGSASLATQIWMTVGEARYVVNMLNAAIREAKFETEQIEGGEQ